MEAEQEVIEDNKVKNKYIFPNPMAKMMSRITLQVQYEASMMSMSLIVIGLIVSVIYMLIYVNSLQLWYKIFLVVNAVAGLMFISSNLVTTFQQYQTYMEAKEFQDQRETSNGNDGDEIQDILAINPSVKERSK